jgi:hypothetical protein
MSAVIQAVHAAVSASPSLTPTATPVVQAAAQAHAAAAPASNGLTDLLNKLAALVSPADVVVLAGMIAAAVQGLLNRFPWLSHDVKEVQNWRRFIVAVVLPFLATYLTSLATGDNVLAVAPWLFLVSQIAFRAVKLMLSAGTPSAAQLAVAADGGPGEQPANG